MVAPEYKNIGPEAKRFVVAEGQGLNIATSAVASLMRLGTGGFGVGYKVGLVEDDGQYAVAKVGGRVLRETNITNTLPRPAQPLQLYEFMGCPFCRKVREAVSVLDLDVLVYPTPKDGPTWRPKAKELGGKAMFPYLVDPNTGTAMYESDDIIRYLFATYGPGADQVPLMLRLGLVTVLTAGLGLLPRLGKGSAYRPSRLPEQPLVLWGYEMSPFVLGVKETLSELELPYLQRTTSRGSSNRQVMFERLGKFQVPMLEDPNAGVYLWESKAIVDYLNTTYGV